MSSIQDISIGFIGLGQMNGAVLQGLLNAHFKPDKFWAVASSKENALKKTDEFGIRVYAPADYAKELPKTDLILLGVKPQKMPEALQNFKKQLALEPLKAGLTVVSLAAGLSLASLEGLLEIPVPMMRAMSNLGVSVGHGVTTLCGNTLVKKEHEKTVLTLFKRLGACDVLPEGLFDAATGLVGSSPAFILLAIEALTDAAVQAGIPRATARQMVPQLFSGAALLVEQSGLHPAQLRDNIVTPAGTTGEGLAVLEATGFRSALAEALLASIAKAKTLG
jgi:pyrroline-5-carboxylate reductase